MAFTALSLRCALLSGSRSAFGLSSMRESGRAGATPVAIPVGAPPPPVPVPEISLTLAVGGGIGGRAEGIVIGAKIGAGRAAALRGAGRSLDPVPLGAGAGGLTCTYWIRSVFGTGVLSRKSAAIG